MTPDLLDLNEVENALNWQKRNKLEQFFPDEGILRRELYGKHIAFFAAGVNHSERLACSGNRTGKTSSLLCYEMTLHCTGEYPDWWPGRRFSRAVQCWLVGKTSETTRDILQVEMLGPIERQPGTTEKVGLGTGMIPFAKIISTSPKAGVPGAVDTVWIRHKSGGVSAIGFKSYGKDRDSFEGTKRDFIGCDEEPPKDVYDEALMRLMATAPGQQPGSMVVTFTPLEGFTEVVSSFLDSDDPDKYFTKIKWVDCPHLSPEEIARMSRKYPKHQLKARSEGEPGAGDGVIYERDIDEFTVPWFAIPDGWPRAFGMDVGKTAVVWGAMNPDTDTLYLYDEYYSEEYNPVLHFDAIKRRGLWIPGVIDPGSLGSSQVDGQRLFDIYRKMGLDLDTADNAVEAGISEVWMRIQSDRLKIFPTLNKFRDEYARYHRQKQETVFGIKSSVVKKHDHLLDACVSADTLVQTEFGPVMIKDLVGKSGRVISRSGSVATFTDCQMTQANAPTVCLTFNDGSEVVCTPDHKFLTMDGWVDAAALPGHTCYNGLAQWEQLQHWKSSLFQQPFRNFKAAVTTFAESISSLREYDFTGLFGWQPTGLVPFPISTTYTTTTTTDPTTSPATSSSYQSSSIAASTQRLVALPTTLRNSAQQQQSGTDQMRAVTGIKGITRRLSTSCMSMLNYIATSAGSCSWPRRAGSAPTTASQSGAGVLVLTTKNALAWFAAQSLWLTGTSGRMAVRDRAVINCVNVSASKPQNVYCLTVPGSHSFCIGSGLVVHNCRYLHTSGIARMKRQYRPAPPQASIFDNGSFSSGGSGWQVM